MVFSLPAAADDPVLQFHGGIGVIPVSAVTCVPSATPCVTGAGVTVTVSQNVVRGVQPGGQIWVIKNLDAKVSSNGSITVNGKGLLLGGGNSAGMVPAGLLVLADLICQTATTPTVTYSYSTTSPAGVAVSPTGDFQINDTLKPTPTFPCASPVLLIQSATNSHWFALGIVGSGDD
jgi:hypothetical protein